jgi:hypothetical protein
METTTSTHRLINLHRAEIVSSLDYEKVLRTIEEITTVQRPRFGRASYNGTYRIETPFTGIVSPERIDLYWWKPLYVRKHLRIHGSLTTSTRSVLELRSGGPVACAIEILAVLMAATVLVLAVTGPGTGRNPFRFILIFAGGLTWFFIAAYRRRAAFSAAVARIAEELASRETETVVSIDRAVSRYKA